MTFRTRLLFGPLGAIILCVGIVGLAMMVPNYNPVRQTVSEIGEMDSPMRVPFAIMLCSVALCVLVFASALRDLSRKAGRPAVAAYLTAFMAVPAAGIGIFAYPHPLHNVFGMSELIGYQAPLAMALTWQRAPRAAAVVAFSWIMTVLVWVAIILNLATLDRHGALWAFERPFYGLVQRALFATWFLWSAGTGLLLLERK